MTEVEAERERAFLKRCKSETYSWSARPSILKGAPS